MLELKTNIIFKTLKELQETVNLGLESKDNWLIGRYKFPMIQNRERNYRHHTISQLWETDAAISRDYVTGW